MIVGVLQRSQAQQSGTVAQICKQLRLLNGLGCRSTYAADANQRFSPVPICTIHFFSSQFQYGLEEPVA
jgi:hypothetical protein